MSDAYDVIFEHYAKRLDAVEYVDFRTASEPLQNEEKTEHRVDSDIIRNREDKFA